MLATFVHVGNDRLRMGKLLRRVIRSRVDCERRKKPTWKQMTANLPKDGVKAYEAPFTYVSVDFFGPIEVKQKRSRVKRYGCLFSCFNTRAVHIEIAHSLNTDSMLNALRRFVSLRGCPREIRSDCATITLRKATSNWWGA